MGTGQRLGLVCGLAAVGLAVGLAVAAMSGRSRGPKAGPTRSPIGASGWWRTVPVGPLVRAGEVGTTPEFAPDGAKFYFLGNGGTIFQMTRGTPAPGRVGFTAQMDLDRRVELAEAFNEAWRNLRTRFYDPKMHGMDWEAAKQELRERPK